MNKLEELSLAFKILGKYGHHAIQASTDKIEVKTAFTVLWEDQNELSTLGWEFDPWTGVFEYEVKV